MLLTLSNKELFTLEKLLCSCEDPNIDFSDTNSCSKCLDDNEKLDEKDVNVNRDNYDYFEDDVDYESIESSENKPDDGVNCLPSVVNVNNIVPSETTTNESTITPSKTENITIVNDTNTSSGYLIANQVNLNCITTPNEAPIIVGHSLPDGDHAESLNLVTETLSSLLNTNTNDDSSDNNILNINVNNNNNNFTSNESVNKCTCFNSSSICYDDICNCFNEIHLDNESALSEKENIETGILKTDDVKTDILNCKINGRENSYNDQSDRLVSPDSGLENSEVDNTVLYGKSENEKINSPSTSKENSSPGLEKNDFICDICGKTRKNFPCSKIRLSDSNYISNSSSSPYLNQPLKDSSLLEQCNKISDDCNNAVVEERNEEWYGIAVGQGDVKTNDVNFYFQNEHESESPSHSELQQNYCNNWEALIPFTTGSEGFYYYYYYEFSARIKVAFF